MEEREELAMKEPLGRKVLFVSHKIKGKSSYEASSTRKLIFGVGGAEGLNDHFPYWSSQGKTENGGTKGKTSSMNLDTEVMAGRKEVFYHRQGKRFFEV